MISRTDGPRGMSEAFFRSVWVAQPVAASAAKMVATTFKNRLFNMLMSLLLILKTDFESRRRVLFRNADRRRAGVLVRALRIEVESEVFVVPAGVDSHIAIDVGGRTATLATARHTTFGDRVVVNGAVVVVDGSTLQCAAAHQKVVVRLRVLERTLRHRGIPHTVTPGRRCVFASEDRGHTHCQKQQPILQIALHCKYLLNFQGSLLFM